MRVYQNLIISACLTTLLIAAALDIVILSFINFLQKYNHKTIGDLVAVNTYILQLWSPLSTLAKSYRGVHRALTETEKLFELMHQQPLVSDRLGAKPLQVSTKTVKFTNVCFSHSSEHEQKEVLSEISLSVSNGQVLAIVGQSGAGKSTIFRLLCRFYDVSTGEITIDDQNIANITQKSLRKHIGVVPQDTILFNDTIAYNISYGANAQFEDIVNAAKKAQIHDLIVSWPEGYDTIVGQRGLRLSGGEKQRVYLFEFIDD
jgi:ABC-type transport system involved in Fe-S cluster assembly fused permease/ATPase subunit